MKIILAVTEKHTSLSAMSQKGFDALTQREQKAYLKAHPTSKFATKTKKPAVKKAGTKVEKAKKPLLDADEHLKQVFAKGKKQADGSTVVKVTGATSKSWITFLRKKDISKTSMKDYIGADGTKIHESMFKLSDGSNIKLQFMGERAMHPVLTYIPAKNAAVKAVTRRMQGISE